MGGTPVRRGILAFDIEGFGQPSRTDPDRAQLRSHLHALLDHALAAAKIPPAHITARSDLGDGILVLLDPAVPAATLLHPLLTDLAARLGTDNQTAAGPGRLRLRIALHEGHVLADDHGHVGDDLNHAFRLLDAQATRAALASNPAADAVLVASDPIYQGIIRHAYQGLAPSDWQPIRVHSKETRTRAWVHLPGLPSQPELPTVLAAPPIGPASLPIPRELPGPTADFTGRARERTHLTRLLDPPTNTSTAGRTVVIVVIDGMGGVGKSTLACQVATRLADAFPDGQLYVNLHGATPGQPPLASVRALRQLLRSLGLDPAAIPTKVEEAAARWRSLAAERRLLVLLDNAHSAEQVRPLVPASPTCAVLVTSRRVLATLDGAHRMHLDLLPPRQAVDLLGRIAGPQRVATERQAAMGVVRGCGLLPLAIRIAGARLAARPTWPPVPPGRSPSWPAASPTPPFGSMSWPPTGSPSAQPSTSRLTPSTTVPTRSTTPQRTRSGCSASPTARTLTPWPQPGCSTSRSPPSSVSWNGSWTPDCWKPHGLGATSSTTWCAWPPAATPPASTPSLSGSRHSPACSATTPPPPGRL